MDALKTKLHINVIMVKHKTFTDMFVLFNYKIESIISTLFT